MCRIETEDVVGKEMCLGPRLFIPGHNALSFGLVVGLVFGLTTSTEVPAQNFTRLGELACPFVPTKPITLHQSTNDAPGFVTEHLE